MANQPHPYYEISITATRKSYRPDDEYRRFDELELIALTIEEVRDTLRELYGDCKRVPMYVDTTDGQASQVGWIYCFNNENAAGELQKWRQQDWVQVMRVVGEVLDPRLIVR